MSLSHRRRKVISADLLFNQKRFLSSLQQSGSRSFQEPVLGKQGTTSLSDPVFQPPLSSKDSNGQWSVHWGLRGSEREGVLGGPMGSKRVQWGTRASMIGSVRHSLVVHISLKQCMDSFTTGHRTRWQFLEISNYQLYQKCHEISLKHLQKL